MPANLTNLFLYLARRDSKGVRILTILRGRPQTAVRLTDLSVLNLPSSWQVEIEKVVFDDRMLWEPWIESAEDYAQLKTRLKKRGYSNLPINGQSEFVRSDLATPPEINVANLPQAKSMLRKKV